MCDTVSAQDFYQMYRNSKLTAPLIGCDISRKLLTEPVLMTAVVDSSKISPAIWWMV